MSALVSLNVETCFALSPSASPSSQMPSRSHNHRRGGFRFHCSHPQARGTVLIDSQRGGSALLSLDRRGGFQPAAAWLTGTSRRDRRGPARGDRPSESERACGYGNQSASGGHRSHRYEWHRPSESGGDGNQDAIEAIIRRLSLAPARCGRPRWRRGTRRRRIGSRWRRRRRRRPGREMGGIWEGDGREMGGRLEGDHRPPW